MHSTKLLLVEKEVQYGSVMYSAELILVGKSSVIKTACWIYFSPLLISRIYKSVYLSIYESI